MTKDKPSRTEELAEKVLFEALKILSEKGGEAPGRDIIDEMEKRVTFDAWAKEVFKKTGYVRWKSVLHFHTIAPIKAGYLLKKKGKWYLTNEGENALKLGSAGLHRAVKEAYKNWKNNRQIENEESEEPLDIDNSQQTEEMVINEIELKAIEGLKRQINYKNPYEFQELVAALLRGMGYYTPFVAPRGKDGGVDIIAYRDPLGTISPRIKVQIKHREASASVHEIRQLMGLLQKDGDVGIFVSTGGFTPDSKTTARTSHVHVELIDLDRFITLWQEFYPKLTDEDKALLPLMSIYFYAPAL